MTKKLLKISTIVLLLLAIALGAYYFLLSTNENVASGKKPFFGNLFPFGNSSVVTEVPFSTSTPLTTPEQPTGNFEQIVRLISNEPVAGSIFISSTKGDIVRYIEKATGHIFDVPTFENTTTRISNTTIPQLYSALFTENGSSFIAQYTKNSDTVETLYGKLIGEGVEKTTSGSILSRSIISLSVSPDGTRIFTLEKVPSGSEGYISLTDGTKKKLVWSSPLRELIPQFISNTHVGLYTKPDPRSQGVLFDINTDTAKYVSVLSDQTNLSTLPYQNKPHILYANTSGLFVLNTQTNSSTNLLPNTFPEKCVWARTKMFLYCAVPKNTLNADSLSLWYRGETSFSDDIWEYNITQNTSRRVVNLENTAGRVIDISSLSIDSKDSLLLVQNKIDGSLWTVKIN